jgi:hypothetical protein
LAIIAFKVQFCPTYMVHLNSFRQNIGILKNLKHVTALGMYSLFSAGIQHTESDHRQNDENEENENMDWKEGRTYSMDWREGRERKYSEGNKYGLERRKVRDWRGER